MDLQIGSQPWQWAWNWASSLMDGLYVEEEIARRHFYMLYFPYQQFLSLEHFCFLSKHFFFTLFYATTIILFASASPLPLNSFFSVLFSRCLKCIVSISGIICANLCSSNQSYDVCVITWVFPQAHTRTYIYTSIYLPTRYFTVVCFLFGGGKVKKKRRKRAERYCYPALLVTR